MFMIGQNLQFLVTLYHHVNPIKHSLYRIKKRQIFQTYQDEIDHNRNRNFFLLFSIYKDYINELLRTLRMNYFTTLQRQYQREQKVLTRLMYPCRKHCSTLLTEAPSWSQTAQGKKGPQVISLDHDYPLAITWRIYN